MYNKKLREEKKTVTTKDGSNTLFSKEFMNHTIQQEMGRCMSH